MLHLPFSSHCKTDPPKSSAQDLSLCDLQAHGICTQRFSHSTLVKALCSTGAETDSKVLQAESTLLNLAAFAWSPLVADRQQ